MADAVRIKFKNDKEISLAMRRLGDRMQDVALKGMQRALLHLQSYAVKKKLSGQVLHRRTGKLAQSLQGRVRKSGRGVVGVLGSNMRYARIHEFGGIIVPRRAPYLVFKIGDKVIHTKKVTMPKRPYLAPTFRENVRAVKDIFKNHLVEESRKAMKT